MARAVAPELAKFERSALNISIACAEGRISEHDCDERTARALHWRDSRIAWICGLPRPKMRQRVPLDDENAGRV